MTPSHDNYVWNHTGVMPFLVYTANPEKNIDEQYRVLTYAELLGALGAIQDKYDRVNILHDQDVDKLNALAPSAIETIKRCYSNVKARKYAYFDIYTVDKNALSTPLCYSLTSFQPVSPNLEGQAAANQPLVFQWQVDSNRPTAFRLQVEQRDARLIWIEAETFRHANDWMFEAKLDHYPDFSGAGYILDSERAGEMRLNVDILQGGNYYLWVRSLRNTREGHRSFVSFGDQKFEFAGEDVPLAVWNWERVGRVDLKTGQTSIVLSREYGIEGWKPILIDVILLSPDPEFDPEQDALWKQVFDTGQVDLTKTQRYILQSGLPAGLYRWRVQLLDGNKLVNVSGENGIWSENLEFRVE
jgi:hypothetical protein